MEEIDNASTSTTDSQTEETTPPIRLPRLSQRDLEYHDGPKNYWRLISKDDVYCLGSQTLSQIRSILVSDGYDLPKKVKWELVLPPAQRSQIGLMSYNHFSTDELESFLHSRGRKIPPKCGRPGFIILLNRADTNRRFKHFLTLSPEIRDIVYQHYIKSLHSSLTAPFAPPLALASKQMLQEFMPRLYHFARIRVVLQHRHDYFFFYPASERFLAHTAPQMLANVRHLEIGNDSKSSLESARNTTIDIDVKTKHFDVKADNYLLRVDGIIVKRARKVVAEMMKREENNTFTVQDILKLKRALTGPWT